MAAASNLQFLFKRDTSEWKLRKVQKEGPTIRPAITWPARIVERTHTRYNHKIKEEKQAIEIGYVNKFNIKHIFRLTSRIREWMQTFLICWGPLSFEIEEGCLQWLLLLVKVSVVLHVSPSAKVWHHNCEAVPTLKKVIFWNEPEAGHSPDGTSKSSLQQLWMFFGGVLPCWNIIIKLLLNLLCLLFIAYLLIIYISFEDVKCSICLH